MNASLTTYCQNCKKQVSYFEDDIQGTIVCAECNVVIDECTIRDNQVTFGEDNKPHGQIVSKDRGVLRGHGESREQTLRKARQRIQKIAQRLRLEHMEKRVDLAENMYKHCLEHGHTRGRPGDFVAAACLYIVCRKEKTCHMLLDFSEALRKDIFLIGRTFFRLISILEIRDIPLVEPWLYVERFANELHFGEKFRPICQTAVKLIAGMKKDWIQTGRRPTSICAAALMISAKIHGCERSKSEVTKVMRICEQTLQKRLNEVLNSSLGGMTVEEINVLDDTVGDDTMDTRNEDLFPPCVNDQRKVKEKKRTLFSKLERKRKKRKGEEDEENEGENEEEEKQYLRMKDIDSLLGNEEMVQKYQKELQEISNDATFLEMSNDILLGEQQAKMLQHQIEEEKLKIQAPMEYKDEEIDDDELEDLYIIKDPNEVLEREKVWNLLNEDYMKEFERRKKEKEKKDKEKERKKQKELEERSKDDDEGGGVMMFTGKKRRRKTRMELIGTSSSESTTNMLKQRMSADSWKKIGVGNLFHFDDDNDEIEESNQQQQQQGLETEVVSLEEEKEEEEKDGVDHFVSNKDFDAFLSSESDDKDNDNDDIYGDSFQPPLKKRKLN